jgi:eukaryotic-like serine/threonine-protein kinase
MIANGIWLLLFLCNKLPQVQNLLSAGNRFPLTRRRSGFAAAPAPWLAQPEAETFREIKPLSRLDDVVEQARRTGRRILAFVYDPAQPERGQLQYCLGYFLQNRKTRETINGAFVIALVPLSQVSAKSKALEGLSMETSRWVVLDADLNLLEQNVIYANAQEGERIATDLAQRYIGN